MHADSYLKQAQAQAETITGDAVPQAGAGAACAPGSGVFATMPPGDGH